MSALHVTFKRGARLITVVPPIVQINDVPQPSNTDLASAECRNARYWVVPGLAFTVAATG
jgi:hypothetical protein